MGAACNVSRPTSAQPFGDGHAATDRLTLAVLYAKPRPMWLAPTLIGAFGDPFIDGTVFEFSISSALSWSMEVVKLTMQVLSDL